MYASRSSRRRPARRRTYRKKSAFKSRKSFSAKRAPVTECKKKEIEPVAAAPINQEPTRVGAQGTMFPVGDYVKVPATWATMKRGFNEDEMTGRDMFLKWLHVKTRLSWSHEFMQKWAYRVRVRCVHGWVMLPGCTPEEGENTDHLAEAKRVIEEEFSKVLAGPDKTKIRILSDTTITRGTFTTIQSDGTVNVPRVDMDLHHKWSPFRKIRYDQPAKGLDDTFIPDPTVGLWIPFYFHWDQTLSQAPTIASPVTIPASNFTKGIYREEMYFTDS